MGKPAEIQKLRERIQVAKAKKMLLVAEKRVEEMIKGILETKLCSDF